MTRVRVIGRPLPATAPPGSVYVGRRGWGLAESPYHNPHREGPKGCPPCGRVHTREEAIELYREHLRANPELVEQARRELRGKALCCWCRLDQPCHADVLAAVVRGEQP
ncbi:MAG TPA: DUF4326 domain-containing protein [Micromonosporaceae bacterium]|nr:DUF4326 domain-containing protein [Micromonosporaceae bacterium]